LITEKKEMENRARETENGERANWSGTSFTGSEFPVSHSRFSISFPVTCGRVACITLILAVLAARLSSADLGPQGIVRQFCQADGLGQRVTLPGWAALAPMVTWAYEPAWDRVVLISGYTVRSPQPTTQNSLAVEVRYDVVARVSPLGIDPEVYAESVTFQVQPDEQGGWHILGPPPFPHIFGNRVDVDAMRRSLSQSDGNFVANTVFLWQMFHSAGWNVPYESTADLLSGAAYRVVDTAKPGDLVLYLRDDAPYHVGMLQAKDRVVSSTLNAGIAQTTVDAFAGEVRYLRLVQPETPPAPTEGARSPAVLHTVDVPATTAHGRPTPAPAKKKRKPTPTSKPRHTAKPSAHKRVRPKRQSAPKRPPPTPPVHKGSPE